MKTISIANGKYKFVMNENGTIWKILRNGEGWPASNDLVNMGVVLALVQEIDEAQTGLAKIITELRSIEALVDSLEERK